MTKPTPEPPIPLAPEPPLRAGFLKTLETLFFRVLAVIACLWAFGAIWFDLPGRHVSAWIWLAACLAACWFTRRWRWRQLVWPAFFFAVWLPWLFVRPSNQRDWAPEYARCARIGLIGDVLHVENLRNFDYAKGADGEIHAIERWESRELRLSRLQAVDMFINYWGSPWMAHPIVSFDFGADGHLAFSIETRRERGEEYSTFGGLFKMYELSYIAGDESDLVRVRTHFRQGESAYLYRLAIPPEKRVERLMEYVRRVNQLHDRPQFYDIFRANCTTSIRAQLASTDRRPFDWRLIANGKMDELLHARGAFVGPSDLPFSEWKHLALVDPKSVPATGGPEFHRLLRRDRPGFSEAHTLVDSAAGEAKVLPQAQTRDQEQE